MPRLTPRFRDLDPAESTAILKRHHVGRIAFALKERVDIEPLHYVYEDGWLYGRTQPGAKLEALTHNRWVAFEVDEIEAPFDWRSVVVRGGFYILRAEGSKQEKELYDRGLAILRRLMPEAMTAKDPMPERAIAFRIHCDEMIGREASTR